MRIDFEELYRERLVQVKKDIRMKASGIKTWILIVLSFVVR